jgi:hypothetical protein
MSDGSDTREEGIPTRRVVLALGAAAASTVVTIRPALAQTTTSVLHCQIPIPAYEAAVGGNKYIAADGTMVPPGTPGAFQGMPRMMTGEEAKALLRDGRTPDGVDPQAAQAYANYIRRLQPGISGFTCYASLQMPR